MNKHHAKSLAGKQSHPSSAQLLLWADGELAAKETAEIAAHLEACWQCRSHAGKLEETISTLVEYQARILKPNLATPPGEWGGFYPALRQRAAKSRQPSRLSRWLDALKGGFQLRPSAWRWATLVAVVAALAGILVLFNSREPAVSASELINRAVKAQADKLSTVAQPVVFQRLKVKRKSATPVGEDSVQLEIWNDTQRQRVRQRATDGQGRLVAAHALAPAEALPAVGSSPSPIPLPIPLADRLQQILAANQFDPPLPLSPASYQAWRRSVRPRAEKVEEMSLDGGARGFKLLAEIEAPSRLHQIITSELIVRASNWHPFRHRLVVQGASGLDEYELTETAFTVVSLPDLNPVIFADLPEPEAVAKARPTVTPATAPVASPSVAPLPPAAELAAAELEARYRLHRLQADLGEQVEIERTTTGVLVSGIVDTAERKEELLNALRHIRHLTPVIRTTAEAARAMAARKPSAQAATVEGSGEKPERAAVPEAQRALRQALARYFQRRLQTEDAAQINAAISQLSNEAVSLCAAAMSEGWALRRLAERYSATEESQLSSEDRQRLRQMVRTHTQRLAARLGRLQNLLSPALAELSGGNSSAPRDADEEVETSSAGWGAQAQAVFREVRRLDRLTGELMTDTGSKAGATVTQTARGLMAAFPRIAAQLEKLEQALAR